MAATRSRPSPDLLNRLARWLARRVPAGSRVCVALSGGRDSVALLHLAHRLAASHPFSLSAVHVHHGLSPNADAWAAFCVRLCGALDVPLTVQRVTVDADAGEGLEAAARRSRYSAFASCHADCLLLAHHRDDQGETVLFNLLRGSGVAGAAGMADERLLSRFDLPPLRLLRPLLGESRRAIDEWLEAQHGEHIEDESNADCRFSRNFLRQRVFPVLEEAFPAAGSRLAAAGERFSEAALLLDELAVEDMRRVCESERILVAHFASLSPARSRNLLRYLLARRGVLLPSAERLTEACRQLQTAGLDGALAVRFGGVVLRAWRNYAYLLPDNAPAVPAPLPWVGEGVLPWAGGEIHFRKRPAGERIAVAGMAQVGPAEVGMTEAGVVAACLAAAGGEIRPRRGGERLRLDGGRPARALKDWCQERQLPPWERHRLPLLWVGERLAWVGGLGVDAAFVATPEEEGWELSWHPFATA